MKEIKIENQTVVVNTENKDIELDVLEPGGDTELYAITSDGKDSWHIVNENGKVVDTITKDIIVKICERELKRCYLDVLDMETFINNVWYLLNKGDNVIYNQVSTDTEDYEKFDAWFEYVCAECFGNGITIFYKQRLLNFE
jgi:hypothetical protein